MVSQVLQYFEPLKCDKSPQKSGSFTDLWWLHQSGLSLHFLIHTNKPGSYITKTLSQVGNGNNFFLETGKKQHVREKGFLSKASGPHKRADVSCHMDKTASRWSEEKMKDHSHSLAWQERKHMTHLSLGHASLQTITKNSREHNRLWIVFYLTHNCCPKQSFNSGETLQHWHTTANCYSLA